MEKRKHRWWILLFPVLLAVVILIAVFWDTVSVYIAPKAVLSAALKNAYSQLETRFSDDPLLILAGTLEPASRYTADAQVCVENALLGNVEYDVQLRTDGGLHQLCVDGTAVTSDKQLDLAWYMDPEFMAVSSDGLVGGNYYGITYDTFAKDIRSIPLISFFISDKMISQWDVAIQTIREQVSRDYTMPQLPELSEEDLQTLMLGILALPCDIENSSVSAENAFLDCQAVTYRINAEQLRKLDTDSPYSEVAVTFYLYQNILVKVQVSCAASEQSVLYGLHLGQDPAEDILSLQVVGNNNGMFSNTSVTVESQSGEDQYTALWTVTLSENNSTAETVTVSYDYQSSSGVLEVTCSRMDAPFSVAVMKTENGFQAKSEDYSPLIRLLTQNDDTEQISGTITVAKGSQITVPAYKNLNQWSMDDFWELLTGVGALIGIPLPS